MVTRPGMMITSGPFTSGAIVVVGEEVGGWSENEMREKFLKGNSDEKKERKEKKGKKKEEEEEEKKKRRRAKN